MQDGVYLGLPHAQHLAAPDRLGSTDFTRLYSRGVGWWWTSPHNPHHVPKQSEPMIFGEGLHTLQLEGAGPFHERFAVMPNPREYPNLLRTADDIRSALATTDAPPPKAKTSKNELVQAAKAYLPGANIWDDIVEKWARGAREKKHLTSEEAFALDAMHRAALADPEMRGVMEVPGGVRMVEVTVLWTCPLGLRKRYRFDSLLPTANVDLKSIGDWRGRSLHDSAIARIREEHLTVQLAMSHEARLAAYKLVESGMIFCGPETFSWIQDGARPWRAQVEWLQAFPRMAPLHHVFPDRPTAEKENPFWPIWYRGGEKIDAPGWCWLWIFYRKPEGGHGPGLLPLRVLWGDDLHISGWRKLKLAEQTYLENVKRFGLSKPWTDVRQVRDVHPRVQDRIEVMEWDKPEQMPGEAEAMEWRTRNS